MVGKQTIETLIVGDLENRAVLFSSGEAGLEINNDQLLLLTNIYTDENQY